MLLFQLQHLLLFLFISVSITCSKQSKQNFQTNLIMKRQAVIHLLQVTQYLIINQIINLICNFLQKPNKLFLIKSHQHILLLKQSPFVKQLSNYKFVTLKLLYQLVKNTITVQMDTNIKISIGMDDNAGAEQANYTRVNFDFQIQKQKITATLKQLQEKTGKFRPPTVIFDFPKSAQSTTTELAFFKDRPSDVDFEVIEKQNRVYKCLDIQNNSFVTMKKKIEKIFSKLTELDNRLYLHLDLYNVDKFEQKLKAKHDYAIVVFLQKSKIEGRFNLDKNFFQVLTQLIEKVSPKFAQSPIMAILPLFSGVDLEVELDSLNQLQQLNQQQLFNIYSYEDPDDDENGKKIREQFKNKDKVYIYLTFGEMAVLKIQLEVRMFAIYNCLG